MAKQGGNISVRAYAATLGIDDKTIRKAIASGKIKKGVSYITVTRKGIEVQVPEINKIIADKEFGNLHKSDKVKPGQKIEKLFKKSEDKKKSKKSAPAIDDSGLEEDDLEDEEDLLSTMTISKKMGYAEAARRRELIGLAMDKKKLQELEGMLVRKDVVEKSLFALGSELKKALFNIPARITADVRAATNDVHAQSIITVELTQILNEFSKMQELKLNNC